MQCWSRPGEHPPLSTHDVHVWRAHLHRSPPRVERLQSLLSGEERTKARHLYLEKDRQFWIVSRGLLRTLLGRYTTTDPHSIRLGFNAYGKPALLSPVQMPTLQFNVSHSANLALFAFSLRRPVGVDVEYMRPLLDYNEIATHSFSAREQTLLRQVPQENKLQAFYNCWTRKEAYIKARGVGLSLPLDLFDVSLLPGEPAVLLQSREHPQELRRWSMQELTPWAGYTGALVAEGQGWHLQCWEWSDASNE